jgi:hypothetical protein
MRARPTSGGRRRRGPGAALGVALAAALLVAGCPNGDDVDGPDRAIGIYGSVLTWVLDHEAPPPGGIEEGDQVPVFVQSLGPEIGLQVQIELVARFEDEGYQLRFIDERTEAVDEADPDLPVRAETVLVGLGPIPEGTQVDVRAEVYHDIDDIEAYRVSLARWAGTWTLVEDPTPVEPEGFVAAP